ncbi:MAG: metal-dependent transcriptional regulator [Chloroflexota bacterium]|nr:metal-dependent transcriptional regulator [Chloroflexota bacterium]
MYDPLIALAIAGILAGVLAVLFWPERGVVSRWRRTQRMTERVLIEDALKCIHKSEMRGQVPTVDSIAGGIQVPRDTVAGILEMMQDLGLVETGEGEIRLTPEGRDAALRIIRAHRLFEQYLADRTSYDESEWHERAERYEHALQLDDIDALSASLGNPTHDPHGDPIPDSTGDFVAHGGLSLASMSADTMVQIVHIEDEPDTVYAQLVAEGLYPGMDALITEISPRRIRFWANGEEHVLAPLLAGNISVVPLVHEARASDLPADRGQTMAILELGERGEVTALSPRIRGAERRRLMDLGLLPGTIVTAELRSPGGDPTAYRIRDALIALREDQAEQISVNRLPEVA